MTGLGVRYTELAKVLAAHAPVTIAAPGAEPGDLDPITTVAFAPHAPAALRPAIEAADVVVTHPHWPVSARWLAASGARLVYDLSDPETFGTIALFAGRGRRQRRLMHHLTLDRLHDALATGHHFTCASEMQRDLWLGALLAQRRIDPLLADRDPGLRSVIDVVPFGLPDEPPAVAPGVRGPRERFDGIGPDAELVLWNGGIWNWLDAPAAVRAVAALAERRPRLRLVFMGVAARDAADAATERTRAVARELGVLGTVVHFNERWVPYAERAAWLMQADCAISTHPEHLESRFAFRTRMLDCFWAGLPVVCSAGDTLGDRVEREGLGAAVAPGHVAGLADALERVLDAGRDSYREPLARVADELRWSRVAAPLVRWASAPGPPPSRPGAAPGSARRTAGHRARSAAYALGGRRLLARRAG
jgi:glycosyltransferase involved in cell wall biosynthesis